MECENGSEPGNRAPAKGIREVEIDSSDVTMGLFAFRESEFLKHRLTRREGQIAHRLMDGERIGSIADALSLSESTVKYHLRKIYSKTGSSCKSDFIKAIRDGIDRSSMKWRVVGTRPKRARA